MLSYEVIQDVRKALVHLCGNGAALFWNQESPLHKTLLRGIRELFVMPVKVTPALT